MVERNTDVKKAAAWALGFALFMIVAVMVGGAAGVYILLVIIGVLALGVSGLFGAKGAAALREAARRFLRVARTDRRCPQCGGAVPHDDMVCQRCGRDLPAS